MWVSIAASLGGKDGAKALKVVEGFMTPADISALQTIARAPWLIALEPESYG
jgi:hypothetical protein